MPLDRCDLRRVNSCRDSAKSFNRLFVVVPVQLEVVWYVRHSPEGRIYADCVPHLLPGILFDLVVTFGHRLGLRKSFHTVGWSRRFDRGWRRRSRRFSENLFRLSTHWRCAWEGRTLLETAIGVEVSIATSHPKTKPLFENRKTTASASFDERSFFHIISNFSESGSLQ